MLDTLKEIGVPIAAWITIIAAIFIIIIEFYKNTNIFLTIGKRLKKVILSLCFKVRNDKRKKYNKILSTEDYLEWQKIILDIIYKNLIDELNAELKNTKSQTKCRYAECFGYYYEALYFNTPPINYPFTEVYNKQELGEFDIVFKKDSRWRKKKKIDYKKSCEPCKIAKKYYRLLKPTIRFPENIGYMLNRMSFERGIHFSARPSTYLTNVYTSNVMEYELYRLYRKSRKRKILESLQTQNEKRTFILNNLPIRKRLHDSFKDSNLKEYELLINGSNRYSLLGVQAMVFCKNRAGSYDALRIRRSEYVDAKAGFLQFIPSGGFSALDSGIDHDTHVSNYSLSKAILRELLEECFGEEDFSGRTNISPESIYSDPIIKALNLLDQKGKVKFQLIGSALSLVSLRHELSFLMVIDDYEIADKIRNNEECANVIQFVPVKRLDDKNFWQYQYAKKEIADHKKLNPTSAALWNLVKETEFYKAALEDD